MGAREVVAEHRDRLMKLGGVNGVAVGQCRRHEAEVCILVYTSLPEGKWPEGLPRRLGDYDVELVRTKGFRAL